MKRIKTVNKYEGDGEKNLVLLTSQFGYIFHSKSMLILPKYSWQSPSYEKSASFKPKSIRKVWQSKRAMKNNISTKFSRKLSDYYFLLIYKKFLLLVRDIRKNSKKFE